MFLIAYAFKGQVHVFAGRVKINVSHSSLRTSAILKYFCPLQNSSLVNSEDPNQMQHNAAFHPDLHCLLRLKQPSGTEIHHNLENFTCDPFEYTMGSPILIVSISI